MGFRIVLLESNHDMRIKLDNLVVIRDEGDIWIPLNDISMIVIDNLAIRLTTRLMCALAEHNIGLILCDATHHPIGYYSSYDNHSRISKNIGYQISCTTEFYDELWKRIVQSKIENQAQTLAMYDKDQEMIDKIQEMVLTVEPGDAKNVEGKAARIYFEALGGEGFSRRDENFLLNSGLDYGYAVVRAYIAKLAVGYGLNTQLGIHHRNEYNRFNLVDDLLEPFRPILDAYVYLLLIHEEYFTLELRQKIINFLNHYIRYNGKKLHMCNALEQYVERIASVISGKRDNIIFPEVNDYIGEEDGL